MSYTEDMMKIVPSLSFDEAESLMEVVGEAQEVSYTEGYHAGHEQGYDDGIFHGA